jgi:hypothetical protein
MLCAVGHLVVVVRRYHRIEHISAHHATQACGLAGREKVVVSKLVSRIIPST